LGTFVRSRKVEGLRFTKVGFENVATNVKGKRKTFHILLEIAVKKPPKISKQNYYYGVKMCLKRKCSSFNNGGFNFSPFCE